MPAEAILTVQGFDLVYAAFNDGSTLRLGMWGALYTGAAGATVSTGTSFGYNLAVNTLPNYFAPAGTAAPFLVSVSVAPTALTRQRRQAAFVGLHLRAPVSTSAL